MSVNRYNSTTGELELISGGTLYADAPIGSIISYGGTTAPDGWMICNGDQVSKTTYSELYAVIGDSFKGAKADPASGNFYLPDLREVTLKGVGTNYAYAINDHGTINNVGGFMEDRVQDHSHLTYLNGDLNYPFGTKSGGDTNVNYADIDRDNGTGWKVHASTISTGRHGATTEVKAVGVNYIIKAKMSAVPADFMSKVDEAVEEAVEEARQLDAPVPAVTTNDFTATADGFVCFRTTPSPGGSSGKITIDVYRNGVKITNFFFVYLAGSGSSETYPCNKGDNFKISTSIECVMLPYK